MAKPFMSLLLQMLYKSCNCAYEQGQNMWPTIGPGPGLQGHTQSAAKHWKSDVLVKSQNPVSVRSPPLTKSKKKIKKSTAI